jgi:hypothetical protein
MQKSEIQGRLSDAKIRDPGSALGCKNPRSRAGSRMQKSEIQSQLGAGTLDGLNGINPIVIAHANSL